MDRHQPAIAPAIPAVGMRITWGWCPEFWRWRVASVSRLGITLADSKGRVRIALDQWLPWLAGRCDLDKTYVDGQRIRCPAAFPLFLPGDHPNKPTAASEDPMDADDLATRLSRAREVLADYRISPRREVGPGSYWTVDGPQASYRVAYDLTALLGPVCSCPDFARMRAQNGLCKHGLALLLRDPKAHVLLLRYLT